MDSSRRRYSRPEPRARVPPGAERGLRCACAGVGPPMKRKLVIGLVAAGLFLTGFGGAVLPASAEPHHFVLKLANGTSVPWTGEPGAAPSSITVAGISIPVVSVQDLGAVVQQVTPTVATPPPAPTAPATPVTPKPKPATTTTTQKSTTPQKQSAQPSQSPAKSSQPTVSAKPKKKASASQAPTGGTQTQQQTTGKKSSKKKSQASDEASKTKKATKKPTKSKTDKPAKKNTVAGDTAAPPPATHAPPAPSNPTFSLAQPGPAAVGVPNFFIDKFRIPPFLLPIYQAAGVEYGVRWEILAAINEIETDYGRNLNVSSAGALGWMQFMPATWKMYGTDANHDGKRDPYNPVDAIFATARYLKAAGGEADINKAIFAYNHA
ncbi:MAG TPA: lytic murein transglycosylase, partial [Beijerinckiaceae bacterium]|nr:lytic murein transglycosylase [Beijerinckiaceae bacterium]